MKNDGLKSKLEYIIIDSREEPKIAGSLDLTTEYLVREDCTGRINFPNNIGECKIYVYSNEGTIPHFHIISNDGFECCVCIYEPLYFNGYKNCKLNSKQRKILDDWLNKPYYMNNKISNWDVINVYWLGGNGDKYVPKNPKKPDYKNMENMKGNNL